MELESDAFVFFGATGDLASKQIFPALQAMIRHGHLDIPIIGVARSPENLNQLRAHARESLEKHGGVDAQAFSMLSAKLQYVKGDYNSQETFGDLRKALGKASRPVYYLAVPPSSFATVAEGLAKSGCDKGAPVVVEKPFGRNLSSAQELNRTLRKSFPESSIFRIDHYLGKEPVQNLLYFRFADSFLEPILEPQLHPMRTDHNGRNHGCRKQGTFLRRGGCDPRCSANHMLEVVALLTMGAPISRDPDGLRAEKQQAFRAMRPLAPRDAVCGQFRGYRNEKGVAPHSEVATFSAMKLYIDTWRWADVPLYIRAGKRLPVTATEVVVQLRRPPQAVFDPVTQGEANYLRFRLSPNVSISLGARTKTTGEAMVGEPVELVVRQAPGDEMTPYERLPGDAIRGDATLFVRQDSVEAAWNVVDPLLGNAMPVHEYESSTWGPAEADQIIAGDGGWHNREPVQETTKGAAK
jgi:glucose-6-phosphate 1-dehydrogenase